MEKRISSKELEGKARTRLEILRVVLGQYMQYCHCEASEQKLEQKPKYGLKDIELSYCNHSICLQITSILEKITSNWMKNDQVMPNWPFYPQKNSKKLTPFCLNAFTKKPHMAILNACTQSYLQNVGTCPGLPLQLLARNLLFFKLIGLNPHP